MNLSRRNLKNSHFFHLIQLAEIDYFWVPIVSRSDYNIGSRWNFRQMFGFDVIVPIKQFSALSLIDFGSEITIDVFNKNTIVSLRIWRVDNLLQRFSDNEIDIALVAPEQRNTDAVTLRFPLNEIVKKVTIYFGDWEVSNNVR